MRRLWPGAAALGLLLLAAALPKLAVRRPVQDVLAVLDITGSMNATDASLGGAPATRLAAARAALRALAAALPCGSRLGIGLFVEQRSFVLFDPVETCANAAPLDREIASIDWRMGWDSESHVAIGLRDAMQRAAAVGADLLFLTDGQEIPPLWWTGSPAFAAERGRTRGAIVGVGGRAFVPIPKFDENGRQIGFWKPGEVPSERGGLFRGREHLTALDDAHLRQLAAESGLGYAPLGERGLLPILEANARARWHDGRMALGWVPAGAALLVLGVGLRHPGGLRPPGPPAGA
jgi:mxaL protein